jgi:hypothetical protein
MLWLRRRHASVSGCDWCWSCCGGIAGVLRSALLVRWLLGVVACWESLMLQLHWRQLKVVVAVLINKQPCCCTAHVVASF